VWRRALLAGIAIWIIGTIAVRLAGDRLLHPDRLTWSLALYAVSFVAMAFLVRGICVLLRIDRDSWPAAATLLILPTLLFDPFSCLFITTVFPDLEPGAAGLFGGWMLICCGGGVTGAWVR
jgi:hypothetical protein